MAVPAPSSTATFYARAGKRLAELAAALLALFFL
jgi:hypothetical protein